MTPSGDVKEALDLEAIAAEIAADLFRDGQGQGATRLVMERANRKIDGCGWSQAGARGRILQRLRAALQERAPQADPDAWLVEFAHDGEWVTERAALIRMKAERTAQRLRDDGKEVRVVPLYTSPLTSQQETR